MKTIHTQSIFLSYICILFAFFVLLFFTKNIFSTLQVSFEERDQANIQLQVGKETLTSLNELKKKLDEQWEESPMEVKWLATEFSDSDILEYIYAYASKVNTGEERLIVRDLSFSDSIQTDIGLSQVKIDLSIIVSSENTLFKFLNFLTSDTEKYKFYITNFSYPMNETTWNIQVNIPLNLYYK